MQTEGRERWLSLVGKAVGWERRAKYDNQEVSRQAWQAKQVKTGIKDMEQGKTWLTVTGLHHPGSRDTARKTEKGL